MQYLFSLTHSEMGINPLWIDKQLAKLAVSVGRVDFEKNKN